MKIVTEEVPPVTKVRKSVPPNVAAATAKSLEKLAADRFESAAKFGEALANPAFTLTVTQAAGVAGASAGGPWNRLSIVTTAIATLLLGTTLWGWLRTEPAPGVALWTRLPAGPGTHRCPKRVLRASPGRIVDRV